MVSTFLMGSHRVYDFIDNNPGVLMKDVGYTNDPSVIAQNPKVTAINSALQIDLTGQICADSLGTRFYPASADRWISSTAPPVRKRGKAIVAMPSVTNKGISKIVPVLAEAGGRGDHPCARTLDSDRTRSGKPLRQKASRNAPVC